MNWTTKVMDYTSNTSLGNDTLTFTMTPNASSVSNNNQHPSASNKKMLNQIRQVQLIYGVWISSFVLVLGLIGNSVIMVVMKKPVFRQVTAQIHFLALAVTDSVVLVLWSLDKIIKIRWGVALSYLPVACHIHYFVRLTAMFINAWHMSYMGIERAIVSLFPIRAKMIAKPGHAKKVVLGLCICLTLLASPSLWMADWSANRRYYLPQFNYFRDNKLLQDIMFGLVPLVFTTVSYLIIFIRVFVSRRKGTQGANKIDKFTVCILVVFLSYILTTGPAAIYLHIRHLSVFKNLDRLTQAITKEVVTLIRQLNYSCNFVIYFVTNHQFRKETKKLFSRNMTVHPASQSGSSTQSRQVNGSRTVNKTKVTIT